MKIRRFRAYAEKDDLLAVFKDFEQKFKIYYVPTYSDTGEVYFYTVTDIEDLGVNFYGSHIGNNQLLAFLENTKVIWRKYQYKGNDGCNITRYSTLDDANSKYIGIDFNGIYQDNNIFPTEISTMHYDDETAKMLYDELKKIFRKQSAKTVNGAYIMPQAYKYRANYRFCTIDIKSPPEYDLNIE